MGQAPTPRKVSLRNVRSAAAESLSTIDQHATLLNSGVLPALRQLDGRMGRAEGILARFFWGRLRWLVRGR